MAIRPASGPDDAWLRDVLEREWGGTVMVVRGESVDLTRCPALIAGEHAGLAIFREGEPSELLMLHAFRPRSGTGTALLARLTADLRERGVRTLRVTTTNDNVDALRFYQRRGFRLAALRPGAVDEARGRKPSIPRAGHYGIALRDEIDLVLDLGGV